MENQDQGMRPGQQNKRGRGRNNNNSGNNNRKGQNPLSRSYDSSGPDVKIRGTAQTVADKYMTLARDSLSSGDRVMAENYLQHAEHYNRIIAAAQAQMQERFQRDEREGQSRDDQSRGDHSRDDQSNDDQSDDDQSDDNDNMSADQGSDRDNDGDGNNGNRGNDRNYGGDRNSGNDRNDRNAGNNSNSGSRRSRPRAERPVIDADSPQPVIEGVPAEVALEQDSSGDTSAAKPVRRTRRPRRAKVSEGGDEGASTRAGDSSDDQPSAETGDQPKIETAAAE